MKKAILSFILLLALTTVRAQEFTVYENGLIYHDTTMQQLKYIVDSLNLKFKTCDLSRSFASLPQAIGRYVRIEGDKAKTAAAALEGQPSFEDFMKAFQPELIDNQVSVLMYQSDEGVADPYATYKSITLGTSEYRVDIPLQDAKKIRNYTNRWVFEYVPKSDYNAKAYLDAFFFLEELRKDTIPFEYASMIQYAYCLIDTNQNVFFEHSKEMSPYSQEDNKNDFVEYIHKQTDYPQRRKKEDSYWERVQEWDSLRWEKIEALRQEDSARFMNLLHKAVEKSKGGVSYHQDEFEEYVAKYFSKKEALAMKRGRIVVGGCSQDSGPRDHALAIAQLSAESVSWEIFLRAHLDIMNDNFSRVSDGSYAWGERHTYLRELELLDIQTLDLLLGVCLRISNESKNHYYGSIPRIGRALAETTTPELAEAKMLEMIGNPALDDYNRMVIFYLYLNYAYYLDSEEKQKACKSKLMAVIEKMPHHLAKTIKD